MNCQLDYIPNHLHTNDKPVVDIFTTGEKLYYRCNSGDCEKPYDHISLFDISHNRNFSDELKYPKEDVLFNIVELNDFEKYDSEIITLNITKLNNDTTYSKELICSTNKDIKASIELLHSPVTCMYTHSVFQISINGIVVTHDNYKTVLGKSGRAYKNIRGDIRQELSSIIQTGKIDSSQDVEFLDEL